jgi:transporter family-2 protein
MQPKQPAGAGRRPDVSSLAWLVLIAAIGGAAITLQAQFMGLMDRRLGTLESVFITYGSGGLLIGLVMLALRGGNLAAWPRVPWFSLLAGVTGLVIVGTIGYSVPRLGLVGTQTLVVAAQFACGALITHYGLFGGEARPLDPARLLGIGVVLLGTWLVIRPS